MSKMNPLVDRVAEFSTLIKGKLGGWLRGNQFEHEDTRQISETYGKHELSDKMFGLLFAGMLLAYAAIAACSRHAPFFPLDDQEELCLVRASSSWFSLLGTDLYHFFRPAKNLMFAVYNWLFFHGGMVTVRAVPLIIGWFSAWAVYGLCSRLLASRGWALAATAIWLLSPTLVSSRAWLSASNILLMTGLAAVALTCHDQACEFEEAAAKGKKTTGGIWSMLAMLFLLLALFSYEGAVSVIALFFVMDWYLHPTRLQRLSTWKHYVLYGLLVVIYLFLRHQAQSTQYVLGGFSNVSPLKAAVSSGYFTVLHAGIWLWPFNQMAVLGGYYWGQVSLLELAGDALVVLAAVVLSIRWRWRYPCVALGTIWFLLAFAPMSNILGFRNGPYCDSYIALASVGMAFALAAILRGLWPLRMTAPARIAAVVIIASVIASRAAAVFEAASWSYAWNNPLVAYERTLRTFPQAFDAMTELAKCYMDRGEYRKADDLTAKSIELAPDRSSSYAIRAVVAKQEGRMEDAMNWLKIYNSKIEKVDAWGLTFLADIYADQMRQPEKAEALYRKAIVRRPWSQDAFRAAYELAYLSAVQGRQTEAVSLWEELLVYQPDDKVLHWNLSLAYAKQGDQKLASYHRSLAQSLGQQSNVQSTNAGGIQ